MIIFIDLIGMTFFILSACFTLFSKKKTLTTNLLSFIIIGGALFSFFNFLERMLTDVVWIDTFGESIGIIFVTLFMITGLVSALERKLHSFQKHLERIVELNVDPILIINSKGNLRFLNPKTNELFKVIKKAELLKSLQEDNFLQKGKVIHLKTIKDYSEIVLEITSSRIEWKNEQAHLINIRNITERWNMLKRLETAFKRSDLYKDILSHDFNNLLQNILSGLQINEILFEMPSQLDQVKNNIEQMKSQIFRGSNLIETLRKLSKIGDLKQGYPLFPLNVNEQISISLKNLNEEFPSKKIHIRIENDVDRDRYIRGNELLLDVFDNILKNAVIHNDHSKIVLDIILTRIQENSNSYLKIEFKDNGRGVEDRRKNAIFMRGFSLEKSNFGMGLGLSLVKQVVEYFKGKVWLENKVKEDFSKGSNVVVIFPEEVLTN